MLHRALQAIPWATTASPGEPGDLPDSYNRDFLALTPISPEVLFATWEIAWHTRNRLMEVVGEKVMPLCRLVLRLHPDPPSSEGRQEVDVSGPSRSRYLELATPILRLRGQLGCLDPEGRLHLVASSELVQLPWDRAAPTTDPAWPAVEEVYERLARTVGLEPRGLVEPAGGVEFARGRDERLGRQRQVGPP